MDGTRTATHLAESIHHETAGVRIRANALRSEFIPWHRIASIVRERVPAVAWPCVEREEVA